jgi:hypothetical protein
VSDFTKQVGSEEKNRFYVIPNAHNNSISKSQDKYSQLNKHKLFKSIRMVGIWLISAELAEL